MMKEIVFCIVAGGRIQNIVRQFDDLAADSVVRQLNRLARGLNILTLFIDRGPPHTPDQYTAARHHARFAMGVPIRHLAERRPSVMEIDQLDTWQGVDEAFLHIEGKHLAPSLPTRDTPSVSLSLSPATLHH